MLGNIQFKKKYLWLSGILVLYLLSDERYDIELKQLSQVYWSTSRVLKQWITPYDQSCVNSGKYGHLPVVRMWSCHL